MLKNAHIWSTGAALIRALAALASVQPNSENDEDPVPGDAWR